MSTPGRDLHRTHVRRRKGRWEASCSCGWSEEVVSGFIGWAAARRHVDGSEGPGGRTSPGGRTPDVRVLGPSRPAANNDERRPRG